MSTFKFVSAWLHLTSIYLSWIMVLYSVLLQADKRLSSLKKQLASVTPLLEDLRVKKEERIKLFTDMKAQIEKINGEISGYCHSNEAVVNQINIDEHDLSLRKLNEYQAHLCSLQKEKVCLSYGVPSSAVFLIFLLYHIHCLHSQLDVRLKIF